MTYKCKVTVIIPIYNAQDYLESCLDSIVAQTIEKSDIEVLLINDGSTDDSEKICEEYCQRYDYFKYYYRENAGVSAARNFGINKATGKYIMYLDSDDQLTSESIKNLTDFFDSVYKKVDLVTYYIQPYKDGEMLKPHARFTKLLTHTAVYDLEKNPYIIQTTMNICVKNLGKDNEFFNENMFCQEDQEYINRILEKKLTIGYCAQACYLYNRNNENSCVASKFHAYYLFEDSTTYFESLFARYEDKVPKYFQALFFHDLRWKLSSKVLYPFHYDKEDFEKAINRIKALLARVDVDIIVKNPSINKKHIHYWLNLKPNVYPLPYIDNESIDVVADGKIIEHTAQVFIKLIKIYQLDNGMFRLRAEAEMPIYNYMDSTPDFYIVENDKKIIKLDMYRSSYSYVGTNIMTNKIYGFCYDIDPEKVNRVSFRSTIDSYEYDVKINFMGTGVFKHKARLYSYARNNYIITYYNDALLFEKKSKSEIYDFEKKQVEIFHKEAYAYNLKNEAIDYRYNHRVWLYSDLTSVEKDNGYYQFQNDFKYDDGIERYYVYTKPYEEIEHIFSDEQKKYLVEFGSYKHQVLYLAAEIIFSSFYGREAISPFFTEEEELKYYDIEHFRIVYMQHGILHASYVNKYSAEKARCDKVVVSSNFEIENLTTKYAYKEDELIKCGMPRYELINRNSTPKSKVLLAPSWRSYFAANKTESTYSISIDNFQKSDYFIGFQNFLNSDKLNELLEKYDIYLDVKMHPIISDIVSELFELNSNRINIVSGDVNLEDYKAFITDFSSFVFDFAYLCRPVLYFVPDYMQFKSGMNLYRDLDLPFEKAFGNLTVDFKAAVNEFEKICANNFVAEPVFKKRMEDFYLPMDNCCEDIYKYVKFTMTN